MYTVVHEMKYIILLKTHSAPYLELPFQKQGYREMLIERGFKVYMNFFMCIIFHLLLIHIYQVGFFFVYRIFLGGGNIIQQKQFDTKRNALVNCEICHHTLN